jgi:ATP-binding cassette subfamily C protein
MDSAAVDASASQLVNAARRLFVRGILYAACVSFFLNFVTFAAPLFMVNVYERVIPSKSYDTLYGLMIIGGLAVVLYGIFDFVRSYTYLVMSRGIVQKMNLPALQASVRKALEGGVNEGSQALRDLHELRQFIAGNAITIPLDALFSLLFVGALYLIHPDYALLAGGLIVLMVSLNIVTDRLTRDVISSANQAENRHLQDVAGSLRHAEVIEAMGMLPALVRRWRRSQGDALDLWGTANFRSRAVLAFTKAVQKSIQMMTVATGAFLVLSHEVNSGVLFAGMVLTTQAISPFSSMIETWRQWVNAAHGWGRVKALLDGDSSVRQTMPAPMSGGELDVTNLVYLPQGRDIPVLRGVSFSASPGEVIGVVGPSGAGKSALARALVGITRPTAGGVFLDGNSTYLWERGSFGRGVGYLPQAISLLDGTVRSTIARMEESDPREVIRAARAADIHDLIGRLPHGYDTTVQDGKHLLSGGQLQRLALARALYGDPSLLVLDEPNSNLDHQGEMALIAAIKEARARGAVVVLIAHRPSMMAVADKILVLEHGLVRHFGPRDEVLRIVAPDLVTEAAPRRPDIRIIQRRAENT